MASALGPDIILTNSSGILAGVEIKNREDLNPSVAAVLRRNIAAHSGLPSAPFFMLLSQDKGYLWTARTNVLDSIAPDREFSMTDTVEKMLGNVRVEGRLRSQELEMLVFNWLSSLSTSDLSALTEAERALSGIGIASVSEGEFYHASNERVRVIVYIESNFPLELARQQETATHAEEILRLAEASCISLRIPAFALCEPFTTLRTYGAERARMSDQMQRQVRELSRSSVHQSLATLLMPLGGVLLQIERDELDRLENTIDRILAAGKTIALERDVFSHARLLESQYGLAPQDAVIYASVVADAQNSPNEDEKCFVSRNFKDFDDPGLTQLLGTHNCKYIASFAQALSFIKSRIAPKS